MISISPSAVERLQRLNKAQGANSMTLRLGVSPGGCSGSGYQYQITPNATQNDKDLVFLNSGIQIVVDPTSYPYLDGAELDYEDTLMTSGFVFHNPNATSTCACGKSFHVRGEEEQFPTHQT